MDESSQPNFELLKDAYEIIDGIPARNIRLSEWREKDRGASCGTIACAAGWLSLHPKFQALGLGSGHDYGFGAEPVFDGRGGVSGMAALFNIRLAEAFDLFSDRNHRLSYPSRISDKKLFLSRVRNFLGAHGQLREQLEGGVA